MAVRKLYYENCNTRSFEAVVTGCVPGDRGWTVTLDATAFYPEGGGQPCDLGTLGGVPVLDVQEREGEVLHLCAGPLAVGDTVEGCVDWQRRFDLMQQHTGEHMVSGIVHRWFGLHNVGFHMGNDFITIDFDGPLSREDLERVEKEVNRLIWEDIPLRCWYPDQETLPTVFYRSKRQLPWPVRIVEIPGVDSCACCGIHTASTGQVGLVKLLSCVKFHQGVRIELLCGGRALAYLSRILEQNRQVSQLFSAKPLETGAAAGKMNEALAAEKFRSTQLQRQLFDRIAGDCVGRGNVLHVEKELTPAAVRELAERIAARCGGIAAVFSGEDGRWDVCLAMPGGDVKELGSRMAKALDGRGGGKPGFFQGSIRAERNQILTFFGDFWQTEPIVF